MAEFKISKFRYTWRGNWATATSYIKDDIVRYGGSSWVCIRKHTSSLFNDDYTYIAPGDTAPSPAWLKMTDGYAWRNAWSTATLYNLGDVVSYGGNLYLCTASHTSTSLFADNDEKWTVYSSQLNFVGDWETSTRYGIGDLARYGGIVYRCIEEHTSGSTESVGLELDQSKWTVLNAGVEYREDWSVGTRYKVNDVVKFGGTLFRCKEGHTPGSDSTLNFDSEEFWEIELPGFQPSGTWNDSTVYQIGDVVMHGGFLYYSLTNNYGKNPSESTYQIEDRDDPADWSLLSKGNSFLGNWNASTNYKTGQVVRRGGNLYVALIDTEISADGSTLDYLDQSNWEILLEGQNFRGNWESGTEYNYNDIVIFKGSTYKSNVQHLASDSNYPINGSGFSYWDILLATTTEVGMSQKGDLLTYDLSRSLENDGSTFGLTGVPLGETGQILSIDSESSLFYTSTGALQRSFYVGLQGVDTVLEAGRGSSAALPWRTVQYACDQADDGFAGFTTINVLVGKYEEQCPIIVPARTVVLGSELRSTEISAAPADPDLTDDPPVILSIITRLASILPDVIEGNDLSIPKSLGNDLSPTVLTETVEESFDPPQFDESTPPNEIFQTITRNLPVSSASIESVSTLLETITDYINFTINSIGSGPTVSGSNDATTNTAYLNTSTVLDANIEFLVEEARAFIALTYPSYSMDEHRIQNIVRSFLKAISYDIKYTGNYKTVLSSRRYCNSILGNALEDLFYVRDATGIRDCTLTGLNGALNPPLVFDLYRRPTGGSYVSLDPGWGPEHEACWINTRSPYIQGVTTIGTGCIGQKIDGNLHDGGNKSIVSNDFTQVLSDGIGAWVLNNGRAELVSVFTYYCTVGYLAELGGIIRATNGNCSYGRFGAVADGVDPTETPKPAVVYNHNQEAVVSQAFAGEVNDFILLLEWSNAGTHYTQATASFIGAGAGADVLFEDFRDNAVFQAKLIDASDSTPDIGGGGFTLIGNNAQVSVSPAVDLTGITLASNDSGSEPEYLGLRIIITSGVGTGQYGYITAYDSGTKIASVSRESDDQPGWDHLIPGTPLQTFITSTTYRLEPRPIFSPPEFTSEIIDLTINTNWGALEFGETTATYTNVLGDPGSGTVVEDDGLEPLTARFTVNKIGRTYQVTITNRGAGYNVGDVITIEGTSLGGVTPDNDLTITVTETSEDSTNDIRDFTFEGQGTSGRFVALTLDGVAGVYSETGTDWTSFNMPSSGDWKCLAAGDNRFVAIRRGSSVAASSLTGATWTTRSMPYSRNWEAVTYGGDRFVAIASDQNGGAYSLDGITWTGMTMPVFGDSSINEWIDITYGKRKFVAIANSNNIAAYSEDGINWTAVIMDAVADSSQRDWISVTYGNNRFVAVSTTGDVAYSFDAIDWYGASMPTQDGSTAHNWQKIRYAQGVFVAVGNTGARTVGGDIADITTTFFATSEDGIVWTPRSMPVAVEYNLIAFGSPYVNSLDSTVGRGTPRWVAVGHGSNLASKMNIGARAKGRVITTSGVVSEIRIWDPGSCYIEPPTLTIVDPNNTSDALFNNRLGDGVLSNPSWISRGFGFRTSTTQVLISGDGYADVIPFGKFVTVNGLELLPGPGAQITFDGNEQIYTIVTIEDLGFIEGSQAATFRLSPELRVRDNLEHETPASIRERYSQARITGHDFLDIGTGNFEETNYPDLYSGLYQSAPENEVVEEEGGRVFYTATDQSGNFRAGELFAVEQATGIVTISADFFDLQGLEELTLGGVRLGGSGVVIREFSTDPLFTEDSNNIIPTQRAIKAYLNNRLTVGGSEIATSSFIAGTVRVGPTFMSNTAALSIKLPKRMDFQGSLSGISGSMLAQTMFYRSFGSET